MTVMSRIAPSLGYRPIDTPSTSTSQNNGSAKWVSQAFVADSARTLSAVRIYISAVAGTLAAGDITCDLYDNAGTSGAPGAAIESGKLPTATITAAGWYDFTGFTTVLAPGKMYWFVWKNVNAVQATNNCTFLWVANAVEPALNGYSGTKSSWGRGVSTNSGSTWSTNASLLLRVAYADGSFDGYTMRSFAGSADRVYSTRESGVKFTSPTGVVLRVAGISFLMDFKAGTPSAAMRFGLWAGVSPSLVAYTASLPAGIPSTFGWVSVNFATVQEIAPGTITRITLGEESNADSAGNNYGLYEITADSDAGSLTLLPFAGTTAKTYFDGSTWTDTAGKLFAFALLLDQAQPFAAAAADAAGLPGSVISVSGTLVITGLP